MPAQPRLAVPSPHHISRATSAASLPLSHLTNPNPCRACQDEWAEAIGIQDEWARRMGVSTNGTAVGGRSASAILEQQLREKEDVRHARSLPPVASTPRSLAPVAQPP